MIFGLPNRGQTARAEVVVTRAEVVATRAEVVAARAEKRKKMGEHTVFGRSSGGEGPHVRSMFARAEGVAARATQVGNPVRSILRA